MKTTNKSKPEFIASFSDGSLVKEDKTGYKLTETFNYWIFKYGDIIYKVYKKPILPANEAIETHLMEKLEASAQILSPSLDFQLWALEKKGAKYNLLPLTESTEEIEHFVFRMNHMPSNRGADYLIDNDKLDTKQLKIISDSLFSFHTRAMFISDKYTGTCDHMMKIFDDLVFQSKKYLHRTFSQAVINMTCAPVQRFLTENKRLFFLRMKGEKIRETHRCLVPSKVFVMKSEAVFIPMHSETVLQKFNDVACDVADFVLALQMCGKNKLGEDFVNQYVKISEDKELLEVMPFYLVLKAYQRGLYESLKLSVLGESPERLKEASRYYDKAAELATQLSNLVTASNRNRPANQEPILE